MYDSRHGGEAVDLRIREMPRSLVPVCSRPRLSGRIESGDALVVLSGPSGSGKSVAVEDWARSRSRTAGLWVVVDESRPSRHAVWRAVLAGISGVDTAMTPGDGDADPAAATPREVVRALETFTTEFTLILDGLHAVEEVFVADLVWILQRCRTLRVVLTTRSNPEALREAELTLGVTVITRDELKFDLDETEQMLLTVGAAKTRQISERIHAVTGGLAVAVRAAAIAVRNGFLPATGIDSEFVSHLGAPLRSILAAQSPDFFTSEVWHFAETVSLPDGVGVDLATRLSGRTDAERILNQLAATGFGEWRTSPSGPVFHYIPALRATLKAAAETKPDTLSQHKRVLATWYAENCLIIQALQLAVELDDFDLASKLLRSRWLDQGSLDQMRDLATVFAGVPLRKLVRHPLLLMGMAISYNATGTHRVRAMELFGLAAVGTKLRGSRADPAERLLLLAAESAAHRLKGKFDRAEQSAMKARDFIAELSPTARDELRGVFGFAVNHVGLTLLTTGHLEDARDAFSSVRSFPAPPGARSRVHSSALLAGTFALAGEIRMAEAIVEEDDEAAWPEQLRGGYIGAFRRLANAVIALERFDFASARKELETMAPHLTTIEHWGRFAWVQAWLDLGTGAAGAGAERLAFVLADPSRPRIAEHLRMRLNSTLALLRLAAARPMEITPPSDSRLSPSMAVALAVRELRNDRPQQALTLIERGDDTGMTLRDRAQLHLVAATALMKSGYDEPALSRLDALAAIMRQSGLHLHLLLVPRHDLSLLQDLAARHGGAETARALGSIDTVPDVWPAPVVVPALSERERVVLRELASGGTLAEIASRLFVSSNTVKAQLSSIYRKLDVNSRAEAVRLARQHGLLEDSVDAH